MDDLRLILLIAGVAVIAAIYAWGRWRHRRDRFYAREDAENAEAYAALDRLQDSRAADSVKRLADDEPERHEPRIGAGLDEHPLPPDFDIDALDGVDAPSPPTMPVVRAPARAADHRDDADPLLDPAGARIEPDPELTPEPEVESEAALEDELAAPGAPPEEETPVVAVRTAPEQLDLSGLDITPAPDAGQGDASEAPAEDPLAPGEPGLIVALTVMAASGQRFDGASLREALESRGLEHGAMRAFHRRAPGGGRSQFAVANVLTPGEFDLATMDALRTPGVVLMLQLPGPRDPIAAFREMLDTARHVADTLGGRVCDDTRSTLTTQSVNHLEERISEFGRQRLLKR